jgi:Zn finger protein HypA/HybF involved in hydrogenase expression
LTELKLKSPRIALSLHCIKCEGRMQLARVQEDERGWELHLYECNKCNSQETYIVKE